MKLYTYCLRFDDGAAPNPYWVLFTLVIDWVYDFSAKVVPGLRESVHSEANRQCDLGGENALLSRHFFYFGEDPVKLPDHLRPIMHIPRDINQCFRGVGRGPRVIVPIRCMAGRS